MKSKVGAIKISIMAIIMSFALYIECQTDFYVCYIVLKSVAHGINAILVKGNTTYGYFFYLCKNIYAWLLQQPGIVGIKCIEMISSGVFGSAIVTLIVYYVEYKIQLKDAIYELIKIQKRHVEQLNSLSYVSSFMGDQNDIKRNAYLEYAQNSLKLRGRERLERDLRQRRNLSQKERKAILERNSRRLFEFKYEYAEKYKEWVWEQVSEEKKRSLNEVGSEKDYLYDAIEELFFRTDFELVAAFYDYREILEKDLFDIERLSEDIYFLSLTKKNREKKEKLVKEAICLDKQYVALIQIILGDCFEIEDLYDYFCGNRENMLNKIEVVQRKFFEKNFEQTYAAKKFKEWYVHIKEEILKESPDPVNFKKPKNTFEIYGSGYALSPDFLRKVRMQNWDYHKFARSDLGKMGYK